MAEEIFARNDRHRDQFLRDKIFQKPHLNARLTQ